MINDKWRNPVPPLAGICYKKNESEKNTIRQ